MAKFYVQCGSFEFLTTAHDARSAVLWAVNYFLDRRVELQSVDWNHPMSIDRIDMIEAMLELDDKFIVSQIGFGRDEAGWFATADILTEWNQLAAAIARLESLIENGE